METPFDGAHTEMTFRAEWNSNPYAMPQLVNQMLMNQGTGTQFGPDGIVYLHLGHVSPPSNVDHLAPDEDNTLFVSEVGYFALSIERVKELHGLLGQVLDNIPLREQGDSDENDF